MYSIDPTILTTIEGINEAINTKRAALMLWEAGTSVFQPGHEQPTFPTAEDIPLSDDSLSKLEKLDRSDASDDLKEFALGLHRLHAIIAHYDERVRTVQAVNATKGIRIPSEPDRVML